MLLDAHTHTHAFTCTWTKEAESHRQPHPGEMFWPVLPFPNFQPGFSGARFLPLPRQPYAATSRDQHKHTLGSIYCCEDTSSCIPCGHFASSKSKHTMRILTDHGLIQESEAHREAKKEKKQIQVMTSQNEGAATVKAPLF